MTRSPSSAALQVAHSAAAMIAGSSTRMDTDAMALAVDEAFARGGGWVGHYGFALIVHADGTYQISIPDACIWESNR